MAQFTPFSTGMVSLFVIEQDASPHLKALADQFPGYLNRALRHLAYEIKAELSRGIRRGGVNGAWQERSQMHIFRRMDLLRAQNPNPKHVSLKQTIGYKKYQLSGNETAALPGLGGSFSYLRGKRQGTSFTAGGKRRGEAQSLPEAFNRWKKPGSLRGRGAMGGYLEKTLRYEKTGQNAYAIGAISPNAAHWLAKVQQGRQEAITPKMRRAFWAAGVPLAAAKQVLDQPERMLVDPVNANMRPGYERMLVERIRLYMEKDGVK